MAQAALFLAVITLVAQQAVSSPAPAAGQALRLRSGQAGSSAAMMNALDYEFFKTRVQPILLSPRKGNARCIACHSRGGGNSFLEPLSPGSATYDEEQSRRNFERIQRLVLPGVPTKSVLLMNPLAEEAGGSHWHGGGKHWTSQNDPEFETLVAWVRSATPAVDFEYFKTRVQPILVSPRKGNARCIACHSRGGGNSFLEPLAPGTTTYDEEQSRRNFERIQRLIVPGVPTKSLLLMNPLAEEAGGSHWHGGGKHWTSQDNAEFQTLAAWVRGRSADGSSR
jgi:hypothetical protein